MKCPNCDHETELEECEKCGTKVSDLADTMEAMIETASIPSLASLYKAGKAKGLIKPQEDYTKGAV